MVWSKNKTLNFKRTCKLASSRIMNKIMREKMKIDIWKVKGLIPWTMMIFRHMLRKNITIILTKIQNNLRN
jgi:hypothetical protein